MNTLFMGSKKEVGTGEYQKGFQAGVRIFSFCFKMASFKMERESELYPNTAKAIIHQIESFDEGTFLKWLYLYSKDSKENKQEVNDLDDMMREKEKKSK